MTIAFLATLSSCDRLKRKGHQVVDKSQEKIGETKQKISDKKNKLVDKVFPTYDNGKPDTENNKKRFKEHLQVDPSLGTYVHAPTFKYFYISYGLRKRPNVSLPML